MLLVWSVLVASLLGSVHCAAMCGAFACMASPVRPRNASQLPPIALEQSAYHLGRLTSYLGLGLVAGAIGARVDRAGVLAGASHGAALVAGCLMVASALGTIAAHAGIRIPVTLAPEWARRMIGGMLTAARDRSRAQRAYLIGLATTLLPCGWLYTFVVVAAGTGSPVVGANVMFIFWIGTLPMLGMIVAGAGRVFGPFARRMPIATALIILALGVLSIAGKLRMPVAHARQPSMQMSSAHVRYR